jgi:hypothetical protein
MNDPPFVHDRSPEIEKWRIPPTQPKKEFQSISANRVFSPRLRCEPRSQSSRMAPFAWSLVIVRPSHSDHTPSIRTTWSVPCWLNRRANVQRSGLRYSLSIAFNELDYDHGGSTNSFVRSSPTCAPTLGGSRTALVQRPDVRVVEPVRKRGLCTFAHWPPQRRGHSQRLWGTVRRQVLFLLVCTLAPTKFVGSRYRLSCGSRTSRGCVGRRQEILREDRRGA